MSKESKQLNIYCNFYHDNDPEPPRISDKAYKAGSFIKCPQR